jgi:hypothetical protein
LLVALPATAQARNFKVDGSVTGPPAARGGAVTVPLQLTKRAGRALNLGTRNAMCASAGARGYECPAQVRARPDWRRAGCAPATA